MATHFSANQYENAFDPKHLGNWEVPHKYREEYIGLKCKQYPECLQKRPQATIGFTQIISNDRGHLLDGVPRDSKNPWGNFVGCWDMPTKLPGNQYTVPTARATYAQEKLRKDLDNAKEILSGSHKNAVRIATKDLRHVKGGKHIRYPEAAGSAKVVYPKTGYADEEQLRQFSPTAGDETERSAPESTPRDVLHMSEAPPEAMQASVRAHRRGETPEKSGAKMSDDLQLS